ncbi:MAG: hypothetical protein Q8O53_03625 [Candidatus Moranbacteria bacterium]|nr:hypothetical protein [Candidatus Moranbacteria bacterium]
MVKKLVVVVGLATLLSGCSLIPAAAPIPTAQDSPVDALGQKVRSGSLWKSVDGGQTFEVKSKVDEKQSITKADILAMSFHPNDPKTIYIGTAESGIFKTTDSGETWMPISFPPKKIYSFILDRGNPDMRMFASGTLGNLGKIFRTDDGGTTWRAVYTEPGENVVITILAQHPRDTNVLFAGTSAGTVVKSTDSGETWRNIGAAMDGPITDIAFDASKPLSLYALSFNSKVYYSANGGATFIDWEQEKQGEQAKRKQPLTTEEREREEKRVMPGALLSLSSDPTVSGRVYVSKDGGLYRSNDFGKNWDKINIIESAEMFPIRAVALNPRDANEISFVAGHAFYKSKNGGNTWAVADLFVDRSISVLAYDPDNPQALYMGLRKFSE